MSSRGRRKQRQKGTVASRSVQPNQHTSMRKEPAAGRKDILTAAHSGVRDRLLELQMRVGNRAVLRLLAQGTVPATGVPFLQRQEEDDEGEAVTLREQVVEAYSDAVMTHPPLMVMHLRGVLREVRSLFSGMEPGLPFFDRVEGVYWDLGRLILQLRQMPEGQEVTAGQQERAMVLVEEWNSIQADIAAHNARQARSELARARDATAALRSDLLYAYREASAAGETPEEVEIGGGTLKTLVENTNDLLQAINEADANISGRSVTPLIPVLNKTRSVVSLIGGWKVTSGLAAESQKEIAALQNAWSLSTTLVGLAGFGKFLPFFGHIGPLLDNIAAGWAPVVSALQEKNRISWQAREVMGKELPHPEAEPGGKEVFNYMIAVFHASEPLRGEPTDPVVKFFAKNQEAFNWAATEVMGNSWAEMPTESSWIFWENVDPDRLNEWVHDNREMVWKMIYGRGMDPAK